MTCLLLSYYIQGDHIMNTLLRIERQLDTNYTMLKTDITEISGELRALKDNVKKRRKVFFSFLGWMIVD